MKLSFGTTDKYQRLERMIYLIICFVNLMTPFVMRLYEYVTYESIQEYDWNIPFRGVLMMIPFVLIFLLHDLVLLPFLFLKGHKILYFSIIPLLCILVWCITVPRRHISEGPHPHIDYIMPEQRQDFGGPDGGPLEIRKDLPQRSMGEGLEPIIGPEMDRDIDRDMDPENEEFRPMRFHRPFDIFAVMNELILIGMLLGNLALKLYMQTLRNADRLEQAKMEQVTSELKSLKYQVNPHFLMNTLNNIQALIDIDSDRAQEVIQQLSKMMRYMLYESDRAMVPLSREIEFMQYFIDLMRIRYPEDVKIKTSFPEVVDNIHIPSLLFISFIENAFKYGVSYEKESIISVSIEVDDTRLKFNCMNTINQQPSEKDKGGIGLQNVRKRLELLYPGTYSLNINNIDNIYAVSLTIPYSTIS